MEDFLVAAAGFVFRITLGILGLVLRFLLELIPDFIQEFVLEKSLGKIFRGAPSQRQIEAERRAFESKPPPRRRACAFTLCNHQAPR
jgi:hypothetical protein